MTFWYLASPYTKYADGIEAAYRLACREQSRLILAGVPVFCPISHTHGAAIHGDIDPADHQVWLPADEPFIRAASGIIMLRMDGWAASYGMQFEKHRFQHARKPVVYMDPGGPIPEELTKDFTP